MLRQTKIVKKIPNVGQDTKKIGTFSKSVLQNWLNHQKEHRLRLHTYQNSSSCPIWFQIDLINNNFEWKISQKGDFEIWFAPFHGFSKVHMFWEGHKILGNLHQLFVLCTASQIIGGDFEKICGLLRIYILTLHILHLDWIISSNIYNLGEHDWIFIIQLFHLVNLVWISDTS